jgi:hypothetical protein
MSSLFPFLLCILFHSCFLPTFPKPSTFSLLPSSLLHFLSFYIFFIRFFHSCFSSSSPPTLSSLILNLIPYILSLFPSFLPTTLRSLFSFTIFFHFFLSFLIHATSFICSLFYS